METEGRLWLSPRGYAAKSHLVPTEIAIVPVFELRIANAFAHTEFMKTLLTRRLSLGMVAGSLLVASAPVVWAQPETTSTNYVLTVLTDRPEALYHKGEDVSFRVKLLLDEKPVDAAEVQCTLSKDGVPPTQTGRLSLGPEGGTVSGKLDEPGFLQCRATFTIPDGKTKEGIAGAGVDPLLIKPSLPVPDDFDAFWAAQKWRLSKVPINARLTEVEAPGEGIVCFDLQADCVGAPISGYFAKPVGAKTKSLPIILTVHGAGVRSSILNEAADWAKRGFLALDLNAHGVPNGKPDKFYRDLAKGELYGYRTEGSESRDTIYFLGMFLRLVRAMDFLTAQPEWDGRTLVVSGSSQGGAQAIVAAGLDSRVTFFTAGVPAMCDHTAAVVHRVAGWPKLVPIGSDGEPNPKSLQAARYYDSVNFATRTHASGLVTVGFIDRTCPPTSVYAAYNALRGKKRILTDPLAAHTTTPEWKQEIRNAILRHVDAMKAKM